MTICIWFPIPPNSQGRLRNVVNIDHSNDPALNTSLGSDNADKSHQTNWVTATQFLFLFWLDSRSHYHLTHYLIIHHYYQSLGFRHLDIIGLFGIFLLVTKSHIYCVWQLLVTSLCVSTLCILLSIKMCNKVTTDTSNMGKYQFFVCIMCVPGLGPLLPQMLSWLLPTGDWSEETRPCICTWCDPGQM